MLRNIITLGFFFFLNQLPVAQNYTTITYFKHDTIELKLNFYLPQKAVNQNTPLIIYVHGGGFSTGDRSSGHPFCTYASENGYAAATISYTLYMRGKSFSCDGILSEKVKAIQIAANQLWQATSFFIKNKDKYNIDTSKIFIAGSSAGAETVLHASFCNRDLMSIYPQKLPASFKYAGLVAGAGAIMDLNLITKKNQIPAMMFHGNCDELVPYATAAHHYCKANAPGWLMLFGSYSIYNYVLSLGGCIQLVTYCGGGHDYSGALFDDNQQNILDFINQIIKGVKVQNHTIIKTGFSCDRSLEYPFCD